MGCELAGGWGRRGRGPWGMGPKKPTCPPPTLSIYTNKCGGGGRGSFIYRNDNREPGEAPQKQGSSLLLSSLKKKKKKTGSLGTRTRLRSRTSPHPAPSRISPGSSQSRNPRCMHTPGDLALLCFCRRSWGPALGTCLPFSLPTCMERVLSGLDALTSSPSTDTLSS